MERHGRKLFKDPGRFLRAGSIYRECIQENQRASLHQDGWAAVKTNKTKVALYLK